jgi:hypothetical protein
MGTWDDLLLTAKTRMRRLKVVLSLLLQVLAMLLPNTLKRILFGLVFGWTVGKGAKIGYSVILCTKVRIGSNSRDRASQYIPRFKNA